MLKVNVIAAAAVCGLLVSGFANAAPTATAEKEIKCYGVAADKVPADKQEQADEKGNKFLGMKDAKECTDLGGSTEQPKA